MKAESVNKGRARWYPCPKCGDSHPSITTILDVIGSPALMGWAAKNGTAKLKLYSEILKEASPKIYEMVGNYAELRWTLTENTAFWKSGKEAGQDAADIGTMCHAWIEAYLHGKEPSMESLPIEGQKAVKAMLVWESSHKVEVIETEKTVYSCKLNFAGTCDAILRIDGELTLADWKTSSNVFPTYPVQLWAYALASEQSNYELLYRQVMIGRFSKTGESEIKIFKRNEYPGIEVARDIVIATGHIFNYLQEWETLYPYKRKNEKSKTRLLTS